VVHLRKNTTLGTRSNIPLKVAWFWSNFTGCRGHAILCMANVAMNLIWRTKNWCKFVNSRTHLTIWKLKPTESDVQRYYNSPISFPELHSPWPAVGKLKRELWEHPFQACAIDTIDADCALCSETGYSEFDYFLCYFKMDAHRALVFRPLVKGNEALGTRLTILMNGQTNNFNIEFHLTFIASQNRASANYKPAAVSSFKQGISLHQRNSVEHWTDWRSHTEMHFP